MAERIMLSRFEEVIWRIDRVATDLGCVRCCRPAMSIVPNVPRIPKRRASAPDSPTILFTTSALIEPIVVIVPLLSDAKGSLLRTRENRPKSLKDWKAIERRVGKE